MINNKNNPCLPARGYSLKQKTNKIMRLNANCTLNFGV